MEKERLEEMRKEIRRARCCRDQGYIFVSYAHRDMEEVCQTVLEWIRRGCNVYIDTDFEYHTSDRNWVDLMSRALTDPNCRMAVCFISQHYAYSYASLLEVLTIRLERERREKAGCRLPVDYIRLGDIETGEVPEELEGAYRDGFRALRKRMGSFRKGIRAEGGLDTLERGLQCVCGENWAEWLDHLDDPFDPDGDYVQFYNGLAKLMKKGLDPFNKNYHTARDSLEVQLQRFRENGVSFLETAAVEPAGLSEKDALFQRASQGDSEAMGELGLCYLRGALGIPQHPVSGLDWLEKAAQRENAGALYLVGHLCCFGSAEEKLAVMNWDLVRSGGAPVRALEPAPLLRLEGLGIGCLSGAAVRGSLPALVELCDPLLLNRSQHPRADIALWSQHIRKLEGWDLKDPDRAAALYALYQSNYYGEEQRLRFLEEAATEHRCIQAMFALGAHYAGKMQGKGKVKNGPLALKWYRRAAESEPAALSDTEWDELVLYRGGPVCSTQAWRRKERESCRFAREQMAECCSRRLSKWDWIEALPGTEEEWHRRARELED